MILNKKQILERLNHNPPIVSNIRDIKTQIQPAGLDLTLKEIYMFMSGGCIDFDNSCRFLSDTMKLGMESATKYFIPKGVYHILLNETFNIPTDIVAFTTSRSSLQRCGATIYRGFFDPGFNGKGMVLLNVLNPSGITLFKDARICQMEFHIIDKTDGYNGIYIDGEKNVSN